MKNADYGYAASFYKAIGMREERIPIDCENDRLFISKGSDGNRYICYRDFVNCFLQKIGDTRVITDPAEMTSLFYYLP